MGYYINPANESKESFLQREGIEVPRPSSLSSVISNKDQVLVCLVNNGMFTAAGIAFNQREFEAFTEPGDYRQKTWYVVPKNKVLENCESPSSVEKLLS